MAEDLLDRLIREAEREGTPTVDAPTPMVPPEPSPTATDVAPSAGASPLAGLLTNPAVLTALPTLLSGLSGKGGAPTGVEVKKRPDRHTALLCAVKPYLGRERQQTADQLISLCRLWDTLQSTGLTRMLPSLLGGAASGASAAAGTADAPSHEEG